MKIITLTATALLSLATATAGLAAPIDLHFEFGAVTGTFYGLDDGGTYLATSYDLSVGSENWTDVATVSSIIVNTFEFSSGILVEHEFYDAPGILSGIGTDTLQPGVAGIAGLGRRKSRK